MRTWTREEVIEALQATCQAYKRVNYWIPTDFSDQGHPIRSCDT